MRNNRPLLISLFVLLSGSILQAQVTTKSDSTNISFSFGLSYGTTADMKFVNFISGFEFALNPQNNFRINPNLIYNTGYTKIDVSDENNYDYAHLMTLEIPVKYYLPVTRNKTFSLTVSSGPFIMLEKLFSPKTKAYAGMKLAGGILLSPPKSNWEIELLPLDFQFPLSSKSGYKGNHCFYNPGILFKYKL